MSYRCCVGIHKKKYKNYNFTKFDSRDVLHINKFFLAIVTHLS